MSTHSHLYHEMMTYCRGGQIWFGLLERLGQKVWAQGPTHYQCIIGCKEMVKQTKKEIENIENEVRGASKDGKYRYYERGYMYTTNEEDAIKWKTENERKKLKQFEDHLNYHKTHKSTTQKNSTLRFLFEDKPQTQPYPNLPPSSVKVCVSKVKVIDTINSSLNAETSVKLNTDTNSRPHPNAKFLVMGAGTTIVNGCYEENGIHNNNPKYRQIDTYGYVVLHNDKPIEIVNGGGSYWWMGIWACADKGWFYLTENKDKTSSDPPKNSWNVVNHGIAPFPTITFLNNEEWSGLENIKEEANDEPEEMFVGKKYYIYNK
jgi:hypothetical protein